MADLGNKQSINNPKRIRVLIVDDHDMLREGLSAFLRSHADLELVGEAANGLEAIQKCREVLPDIILMDLVMPVVDGVEAIRMIHAEFPQMGIIALTSFGDDKVVKAALNAGAKSYLLKTISAKQLADAIRTTYSGIPTLAPEVARVILSNSEEQRSILELAKLLTAREKEVFNLLIEGYSNDRIALDLQISRNTVKNHLRNIFSKLNVKSRTEAILLGLKQA